MRGVQWERICRGIGVATVAMLVLTTFTPLAHQLDEWTATRSHIERADAIVVLAQGVSSGGILTPESALRTERALALYRQGLAPRIVFLGGSQGDGPTEADVRARLARLDGVPGDAILTESRGRTTREEAILVKQLLYSRAVATILLVTNSGHLRRAQPLFERAGFKVHPVASDAFVDPGAPEERLALMRGVVEEVSGWMYYRLAGFI